MVKRLLNNTNSELSVGDLICFKKNYRDGTMNHSYGTVIDEKMGPMKVKLYKIKWFDDEQDTWHPDPKSLPNYRKSEITVISSVKENNNGINS